jgi:ER lumen protein retaining receptor
MTDLLWNFYPVYNVFMKLFFIVTSFYILFLLKRGSHDADAALETTALETFRVGYVVMASLISAVLVNYNGSIYEVP